MRLFLSISATLIGVASFAQPVTFQKVYGNSSARSEGYSTYPTNDGGHITLGALTDSGNTQHPVLIKTDSNGDTIWTRDYHFDHSSLWAHVQQTADGGYIFSGTTYVGPFPYDYDAYLMKTKSNGDAQWLKTYGGTRNDHGMYVQELSGGGYIMAGYGGEWGAYKNDIYLIRTNSLGDTLWTKSYGGTGEDDAYSVAQTTDGGFIIFGNTQNSGSHACLIKTSMNGDTVWTKTYSGQYNLYMGKGQQTSDGGYILAGNDGSVNSCLIKTDANGQIQWTKRYAGPPMECYFVQQTNDAGYILGGKMDMNMRDGFLIKTDSNGDTLWAKYYGNIYNDYGWSARQTWDGGYILTGSISGIGLIHGDDLYLVKTDSLGNSGCNDFSAPLMVDTIPITTTHSTSYVTSAKISTNTLTFTVTSDFQTKTLCEFIGINEIEVRATANLAPNPFSSTSILSLPDRIALSQKMELTIYNLLGEKLKKQNILSRHTTISREGLPSGMYFCKITSGSSVVATGKFIIQ